MSTALLRMGQPDELEPKPPRGQQTREERDRWVSHPGYGIMPERAVRSFLAADRGYPQQQCDIFDDVIETDAHLRSQLETRRHAVAGKEWIVQAGGDSDDDKRAATLLEEALRRAPSFASMLVHQLTAPWYGYAATEVVWENDGARFVPAWFVNVPHRRFVFDEQDDPLLVNDRIDAVSEGVVLEAGRWIFGRMPGRLIAASGLLRTAARLSFAKRMCMRDSVDASARLGMPIPLATYPIGYPETEQAKALAFVEMIARGGRGYGAMGEGVVVQFLKADFGGSENFWVNLVSLLNAENSKLITGATLTSGEGTSAGSYALGAVHENVAYQIVKADAKWLGDLFERYIGIPFCRFNRLNARPPRLKFHLVLQEDPTARVSVMKAFIDMGGQIDLDQAQQELQFKQVTGPALGAAEEEPPPQTGAGQPAPERQPAMTNGVRLSFDPNQPRDADGKWSGAGGGGGRAAKGVEGIRARVRDAGDTSGHDDLQRAEKAIADGDIEAPHAALEKHAALMDTQREHADKIKDAHGRLREAQRDAVEKVRTLDESLAARAGSDDIGESLVTSDDLDAAAGADRELLDAHGKLNEVFTGDRPYPTEQDLDSIGGRDGVPFETAHADAIAAVQKLEAEHAAAIAAAKDAEAGIEKARKATIREAEKYQDEAERDGSKVIKVPEKIEGEPGRGPDGEWTAEDDAELDRFLDARGVARSLSEQISGDAEENFGFDSEDAVSALRDGARAAKALLRRIEKAGQPKAPRKRRAS